MSAAGLVDSHCHLDHQQFGGELEALLERASAAGVQHFLTIGTADGPASFGCSDPNRGTVPQRLGDGGGSSARCFKSGCPNI